MKEVISIPDLERECIGGVFLIIDSRVKVREVAPKMAPQISPPIASALVYGQGSTNQAYKRRER